jgi:hypothetical protein
MSTTIIPSPVASITTKTIRSLIRLIITTSFAARTNLLSLAATPRKSVAAAGTSRLPCSQGEPSARSENCSPSDVERVHADAAREIEELDDPPQDE